HFDQDGVPIGRGCKHGLNCNFVHPEDYEWRDLLSTKPRQARPRDSFTETSGRGRGGQSPTEDRSRQYWNSWRSPPRRSLSRSRSPWARDDRRAENVAGPSTARGEQQAGPSSSSRTVAPTANSSAPVQAPPIARTAPPLPTPPTTSSNFADAFPTGSAPSGSRVLPSNTLVTSPISPPTGPKALRAFGVHKSSISQLPMSPTTPIQTPQASTPVLNAQPAQPSLPPPPPPPPPSRSPPMQPPHPLPDVPEILSTKNESPAPDVDVDTKKTLWEKRTNAFAKCARLLENVTMLDKECADADHVLQSMFFSSLPESERTRLKEQHETLLAQRQEVKKEYEATKLELVVADAWPTGPSPTAHLEDDMREKQTEISKYVQELSTIVWEMQRILGDIQKFKAPPLFLPNSDDEGDEAASAMDVDGNSASLAPTTRKRRRLEDGSRAEIAPSQDEMNNFMGVLTDLEDKVANLKNDITAHDQDLKEMFKDLMETRIEEVNIANAEARREKEEKRLAEEQQRNATLATLNDEMSNAGLEVGELAKEIADLITRASDLEIQLAAERRGKQEALNRLSAVEERMKEYNQIQEQNQATVNTLKQALEAYKATPPSPPLSPKNPSTAYILSVIEERVTDSLRMTMKPYLEELRRDMEGSMSEKNREVYGVVWEKIAKSMKVMEKIKARIDSGVSGDGVARGANQA
ncbi:hypothetical protein CVT25_009823, partial [Psilocybe cyanescens]